MMTSPPRALKLVTDLLDELKHNLTELSSTDVGALKAALKHCTQVMENPTNPLDPVNRLPIELLEIIFRLTMKGHGDLMAEGFANRAVRLSHVSHRWRQVTVNLPRLWIYIDLEWTPLPAFLAFVHRSRSVPLHIILATYDAPKMKLLRSVAHRIYELQFLDSPLFHWTTEDLRELGNLSFRELQDCALFPSFNPSFRWPAFLADGTSKLKRLQLDSVSNILPAVRFPSLTHLTVCTSGISLSAILGLLSQSPLLQVVRLDSVCPPHSWDPASDLPVVKLDRLAILSVKHLVPDVLAAFISKVDINPMAAVDIGACIADWQPVDETLPPELSKLNAIRSATTLYIETDEMDYCTVVTIIGVAAKSLPAIHLRMTLEESLLLDSLDMFSLSQITEMWLGLECSDMLDEPDATEPEGLLSQILQRLPALRTMSFNVEHINVFSHVLSEDTSSPDSDLCPDLEVIRIAWNMQHKVELLPQSVFKFVARLSRCRPTVRVYVGTMDISNTRFPSFYHGKKTMTPCISSMLFRTMELDDHRSNWEICFGLDGSD